MGNTLQDKAVVLVGYGGIARAVTLVARSECARVVVAGRDKAKRVAAYDVPDITAEVIDAAPIAVLADRVGPRPSRGVDRLGPRPRKASVAGTQESAAVV
jgi:hypothetical protein